MNARRFMDRLRYCDWSLLLIRSTGNRRLDQERRPWRASHNAGTAAPRQRLAPNHAAALTNDHELIRIDARDRLRRAARPGHLDAVGARARAEADVDPQIVLRTETAAAAHLVDQPPGRDVHRDPRADGAAVRARAHQLHDQAVPRGRRSSCGAGVGASCMLLTTTSCCPVLKRSPKAAPRAAFLTEHAGSRAHRHILEAPVAEVAVQQLRAARSCSARRRDRPPDRHGR